MKMSTKSVFAIGFSCCLLASTASASVTLFDFSFAIYADQDVVIDYEAVVAPWNGNVLGGNGPQGAGTPIWTGPSSTLSGNGTFQTISVTTPGLNLPDGNWFIGLYATSGNGSAIWGVASLFSHVAGNGGGGFNFNNGPLVGTWDDLLDLGDLAFTATLSSGNLNTFGSWDGSLDAFPWGASDTQVYGQTIVVTSGTVPEGGSTLAVLALALGGVAALRRKLNAA